MPRKNKVVGAERFAKMSKLSRRVIRTAWNTSYFRGYAAQSFQAHDGMIPFLKIIEVRQALLRCGHKYSYVRRAWEAASDTPFPLTIKQWNEKRHEQGW